MPSALLSSSSACLRFPSIHRPSSCNSPPRAGNCLTSTLCISIPRCSISLPLRCPRDSSSVDTQSGSRHGALHHTCTPGAVGSGPHCSDRPLALPSGRWCPASPAGSNPPTHNSTPPAPLHPHNWSRGRVRGLPCPCWGRDRPGGRWLSGPRPRPLAWSPAKSTVSGARGWHQVQGAASGARKGGEGLEGSRAWGPHVHPLWLWLAGPRAQCSWWTTSGSAGLSWPTC